MPKNLTRIILGLLLLAAAYYLHREAINWANRSVGMWIEGDPLPRADKYFGPDPDVYFMSPQGQEKAAKGDRYELLAQLSLAAACVLILLGLAPYVFSLLAWLFIPDFLRRPRHDPAIEMVPEPTPTDSDEPPGQGPVPVG